MTTDELGQGLMGAGSPPTLAQVLALVDRLLHETGRRRHMFGWLRVPGGGTDEWLVVDAYYPSNRLVVLWCGTPGPHDQLYIEQIPAHGLRLLELGPADLGSDLSATAAAIERKLAGLGPAPERYVEPAVDDGPTAVARAVSSFAAPSPRAPPRRVGPSHAAAAERAARFVAAHRPEPRGARRAVPRAPSPRSAPTTAPGRPTAAGPTARAGLAGRRPQGRRAEAGSVGFWVTLVLAAALIVEVYAGVGGLGIEDGRPLLAFGLALDVCSRALGTIAAGRAGRQGWALACALGGSPFVAGFALFQPTGPVEVEPAPLAGLIALIACAVVALAIAVAALGG